MRYMLLMNYAEPAPGDIPEEAIQETQEAFGAYGRALHEAGVLVAAEVLTSTASTTTLTLRARLPRGAGRPVRRDQGGPGRASSSSTCPTSTPRSGWAEKCPGAQFGVMEVRAATPPSIDGAWTASCPL